MWETSKIPTFSRTAKCSSVTPEYCTGMSKPAKGFIFAPRATCLSNRAVFLFISSNLFYCFYFRSLGLRFLSRKPVPLSAISFATLRFAKGCRFNRGYNKASFFYSRCCLYSLRIILNHSVKFSGFADISLSRSSIEIYRTSETSS